MKKSLLVSVSLGAMFMFSGCATLFGGGPQQPIAINSDKPMIVTIGHTENDQNIIDPQIVKIPSIVNVTREHKDILIKTKDNKKVIIKKKLNPWFWGDVLATSLLSTTVDGITGSMWKYDDNVNIHNK